MNLKLLCYGHDLENEPLPKWKRDIVSNSIWYLINKVLRTARLTTSMKKFSFDDVDYKYYLGDNYKDLYVPPKSGVVASFFPNH